MQQDYDIMQDEFILHANLSLLHVLYRLCLSWLAEANTFILILYHSNKNPFVMILSGMSGILLRNASSVNTYITHTVKPKVCVV